MAHPNKKIGLKCPRRILIIAYIVSFFHAQITLPTLLATPAFSQNIVQHHLQTLSESTRYTSFFRSLKQRQHTQPHSKHKKRTKSKNPYIHSLARQLKKMHALLWGTKAWPEHYLRRFITLGSVLLGTSVTKDIGSSALIAHKKQLLQKNKIAENAYVDRLVQERSKRQLLRHHTIDDCRAELQRQLRAIEQDANNEEDEKQECENPVSDQFMQAIIDGKLSQAEALIVDRDARRQEEAYQIAFKEHRRTVTQYVLQIRNELINWCRPQSPELPQNDTTSPLNITVSDAQHYIRENGHGIISELLSTLENFDDLLFTPAYDIARIIVKLNDVVMLNTLMEIKKPEGRCAIPWQWIVHEKELLSHLLDHKHFDIISVLMGKESLFPKHFWKMAMEKNDKTMMQFVLNHANFISKPLAYSLGPILDSNNMFALHMFIRYVQNTEHGINVFLSRQKETILNVLVDWGLENTTMLQFLIDNGAQIGCRDLSRENVSNINRHSHKHYGNYKSRQKVAEMLIAQRDNINMGDETALYMAIQHGLDDEAQDIIYDGYDGHSLRFVRGVNPEVQPKIMQALATYTLVNNAEKKAQHKEFLNATPLPEALILVIQAYAARAPRIEVAAAE